MELIELVGEHTDPRCDELGDAPFEEKLESLGDAIEQAIDDVDTTTGDDV